MVILWYNSSVVVTAVCMSITHTGIRGTYQGLTPTILKQSTNQMIRFFVFENLKHWIQGDDFNKDIGVLKTALCGATAGAASVFGNTPIDVVKTRMQVYIYQYDHF